MAFQLWGTALYTDHAQSNLRKQVGHELGRSSLPLSSLGSARPGADPKGSGLPAVATSVAPTTAPPPVGQPIGLIAIPKLGLDDALVEGTGEAQLQGGPGHYQGTALPGQAGNSAIAGHRTTFAAPFYNLNELTAGDPIFVLTSQGLFRYDVKYTEIVSPTDNAVLDSATTPELTLTTCNPRYSASQRLVVVALLDTTSKPGSKPTTPVAPPRLTTGPSHGRSGKWRPGRRRAARRAVGHRGDSRGGRPAARGAPASTTVPLGVVRSGRPVAPGRPVRLLRARQPGSASEFLIFTQLPSRFGDGCSTGYRSLGHRLTGGAQNRHCDSQATGGTVVVLVSRGSEEQRTPSESAALTLDAKRRDRGQHRSRHVSTVGADQISFRHLHPSQRGPWLHVSPSQPVLRRCSLLSQVPWLSTWAHSCARAIAYA